MTNPEISGIARMTNVVPPLQQMGRLTAECTAHLSRGTLEQGSIRPRKTIMSATLLACSAAVMLMVGAAVGLSSKVGASFENAHLAVPTFNLGSKLYDAIGARETVVREEEVSELNVADAANAVEPSVTLTPGPPETIETVAEAQPAPRLAALSVGPSQGNVTIAAAIPTITEDENEPRLIEPLYVAVVSGLPEGSRVSMGMQLGKSEWVLALNDLNEAQVSVPGDLRKPIRARVEISDEKGGALAKFPIVVDAQGRINTDTVASVAGTADRAVSPRNGKAAKAEQSPSPKAPKGQKAASVPKPPKGQKAASVPKPPKRKASPVELMEPPRVLRPQIFPFSIIRNDPIPPPTIVMPTEEDDAVTTPVRTLGAGTAGLVTFKTFTNKNAQ